jgi:hypothetical protein
MSLNPQSGFGGPQAVRRAGRDTRLGAEEEHIGAFTSTHLREWINQIRGSYPVRSARAKRATSPDD